MVVSYRGVWRVKKSVKCTPRRRFGVAVAAYTCSNSDAETLLQIVTNAENYLPIGKPFRARRAHRRPTGRGGADGTQIANGVARTRALTEVS